jgi:hypothetical protein
MPPTTFGKKLSERLNMGRTQKIMAIYKITLLHP